MPTHGLRGRLRRCAPRRLARSTSPAACSCVFTKGVAPMKAVPLAQLLVEVLHVPAPIVRPVLIEHPRHLIDRHPLLRSPPQTLVHKTLNPLLLVAHPVAPELPLRTSQQLARLHRR